VASSQICVQSAELDHAKPDCSELDYAEPNQGLYHQIIIVRSVLFWDIAQCTVVTPYRHFRTTYQSHLFLKKKKTEREREREQCVTEVN